MTEQAAENVTTVQSVEEEVQWAVRWSPSRDLVETGAKPPWAFDYQRWSRSDNAVVYRRTVTTTTTTTTTVSGWAETDD